MKECVTQKFIGWNIKNIFYLLIFSVLFFHVSVKFFLKKKLIPGVLKGNAEKRAIATLGHSWGRKVPDDLGPGSEGKMNCAQRGKPELRSVLSLRESARRLC